MDIEKGAAPEAQQAKDAKATNRVFPYNEPTEHSQQSVIIREIDYSVPEKPTEREFTSLSELEQSIQAKGVKNHWFSVHAVTGKQASSITMDAAMYLLQQKCDLEPYSVKDSLTPSIKTKVDHDDDSLYVSILCFNIFSKGALADLIMTGAEETAGEEPVKTQISALAQKVNPAWERVCAFLTPMCVVTVFPQPESQVVRELWSWYSSPTTHLLERQKGPDFLYYKLLEVIVEHLPPVLAKYRMALLRFEDRTFKSTRPSMRDDVEQTLQLHLMQRELSVIHHYMRPAQRVLETILALPTETGENQMSVNLIDAETIDCLEEVRDDVIARLHELEMLSTSGKDLVSLMFNLTAYRSTVSSQTLAGVSTLFLPLTWWCGVYGTNFVILPELAWGVEDFDWGVEGWAGGYCYFWCMMLFFTIASCVLLRYLRVF